MKLPPYVDYPGDVYAVIFWTTAWAVSHYLIHRGIITPLANAWFPSPPSQPTVIEPSETSSTISIDSPTKSHPSTTSLTHRRKPSESSSNSSSDSESAPLLTKPASTPVPNPKKSSSSTQGIKSRFSNSVWKCIVYGVSTVIGVCVLGQSGWWCQPPSWMQNEPDETTSLMKLYYHIGFGSYLYQTLTVASHPKQSDFWAVVVHHISTVSVMAASYLLGFTRIGIVILLLHDCSDPVMEIAKCFLYLGWEKVADVMFTLFAVVFLVTRNVLFPYVIYTAHENSILEDGERMPRGYGHWVLFCLGCLWILAALNMFWGYLIIKIAAMKLITNDVVGDIREEDSEE